MLLKLDFAAIGQLDFAEIGFHAGWVEELKATIITMGHVIKDWWSGLTPSQKVNRSVHTVLLFVAVLKVAKIAKLKHLKKSASITSWFLKVFKKLDKFFTTETERVKAKAEKVAAIVDKLTENRCFTAGTMIATIDREKPIEEIRVGDLVWSADEHTGETGITGSLKLIEINPIMCG